MKTFALIGACGYIAPRHLRAIKDTGNALVVALDRSDSAGILDSYFPDARFFTEFERFDRYLEKLRHKGESVDYVSICSPNYLHDAHVRFALRIGAEAICEKPLVINPWNAAALGEIEAETGRRINTILQLRLHPAIQQLKQQIDNSPGDTKFDVDLTYITSRGRWYEVSWKGDESKSGGITTNIGIHFFDMLTWIFGRAQENVVHLHKADSAAGYLELERARVRWFLSLNRKDLPVLSKTETPMTYRSVRINGKELEFSGGFTDLHTESYKKIIAGEGFRWRDVMPSLEIAHVIRHATPTGCKGDYHPNLIRLKEDG
ncbi:MAG: Gfo/Idh/MocA family oxidoreductase [Phycisphaerae bacterium]|nr:Gfo/Idh/MocA family oxidoreductase [Phycisphaerae bacterium]